MHTLAVEESTVRAAEVEKLGLAAVVEQLGVFARDGLLIEDDRAVFIASQDDIFEWHC